MAEPTFAEALANAKSAEPNQSAPAPQATETPEAKTDAPSDNDKPNEKPEGAPEAKTDAPAPAEKPAETEKPAESAKAEPAEKPAVDDQSRKILEAVTKGGPEAELAIKTYLELKHRDYGTMSDQDVLRESLKLANPDWNDKDVALEMKQKYKPIPEKIDISEIDEYDTDEIARAEEHNENVDYLLNVRERETRKAREALTAKQAQLELPVINAPQTEVQEYTPEQIAEANRQWEEAVVSAIPTLSDITFKVGKDEEVTYKADADEKEQIVGIMKDFNDVEYLTKRGWYDEQGNMNILKVAEDVRILENYQKLAASVGTQMKNAGKKETIAKDIKNLTDPAPGRTAPKPQGKTLAETMQDAKNSY